MSRVKDEIAAYALGLIGQRNFSSLSYDDISRRFGMTRAAVHYHFRNKDDLGVAACEMLRGQILAAHAGEVEEARKGRHPWLFLAAMFKKLAPGGICPIVSLQGDFENLPKRVRAALAELTRVEIECFRALARAYDPDVDAGAAVTLLLSLKGALQYRRVMGEVFFRKAVKDVKARFYAVIPGGRSGKSPPGLLQ